MFRTPLLLIAAAVAAAPVSAAPVSAAPLAHLVYLKLAEPTEANRQALVAACHKHLSRHDGTMSFAVGVLAPGLERPVNDRDFDVSIHMVFESRAAHDKYQTHPRHQAFIDVALPMVEKVRVFDSELVEASAPAEAAPAGVGAEAAAQGGQ